MNDSNWVMCFIPASGKGMVPEKIWDMATKGGKMVKKQPLTNATQAYWTLIMEEGGNRQETK